MLAQPEQEDCGGENEVMSSLKSGDMGVGAHTHTLWLFLYSTKSSRERTDACWRSCVSVGGVPI